MIKLRTFNFEEGRVLNKKYRILSKLGEGWEGQVYSIQEISTGIIRAAKFFYPERNNKNKTVIGYAKKLNHLNDAPIVIKYITQEEMTFRGFTICYLVSEYIDGFTLDSYITSFTGKKVPFFEALHIFYQLVKGVEQIHIKGDFHGDLHSGNVLIRKKGLSFDVKLIDLFLWKGSKREFQREDLFNLMDIFLEMLGGSKSYAKLPQIAKDIICAKRRNLITKKFPRISTLRVHLENLDWSSY